MAKINLLPWREAYRKEKKEQFLAIVGGVVLFCGLIAYLWIVSVESSIENQQARNQLLNTEIAALEKQVKEIADLKKVRDDLLSRIKIIKELQDTRPIIVRSFDDFARSIPDGVFVTMVAKTGTVVNIEGIAESYNRVATFMRNLDSSDWFASANLTSVVAAPSEGEQAQSFKISVNTSVPTEADAAGKNDNNKPASAKKEGAK